jgi:hypothetical protein
VSAQKGATMVNEDEEIERLAEAVAKIVPPPIKWEGLKKRFFADFGCRFWGIFTVPVNSP